MTGMTDGDARGLVDGVEGHGVMSGLRVIDFSQGMAGPMTAMIMADNGADVIKIEPPAGDWARGYPGFLMWNRGKRSAVLNLRETAAQEAALALIVDADVVVESSRPGTMTKFGLDYDTVASVNPRVVYCSISGFGELQRYAGLKGYEGVVAARIGRMMGRDESEGLARDTPRNRPIFPAVPRYSYGAAQLAVQGIAAAILARGKSGRGDYIQTSLLEGATATVLYQNISVDIEAEDWRRQDLRYLGRMLTFLTAECSDGKYIQMCARQDQHFANWMKCVGLDDVLADPRYERGPLSIPSVADIQELESRLIERMKQRTQAEWMQLFIANDVGADPFLTPEEFLQHPQLLANDGVIELDDPSLGKIRQLGPLVRFQDVPLKIPAPAPKLGGATAEVLAKSASVKPSPTMAREGADTPIEKRSSPLEGLVILELAYYLAGPMGPTLLAEMGARVIKVEPLSGDPMRRMGSRSASVLQGKESIAMDLKTAEGKAVLQKLISKADVLVTNFRGDARRKLGFDYESAKALNDQLIYVYAASYGSRGPESGRPAFHSTPNALSGAGVVQAGKGNAPVDDGFPDPSSALGVGTGILMGVLARQKSGRGLYVETTMLVSSGYAVSPYLVTYDGSPGWRMLDHGQHGDNALYRLYECASGWLFLGILQEKEWVAFASAIGRPEWRDDPRFATSEARLMNDDVLTAEVAEVLAGEGAPYWAEVFEAVQVGAAQADNVDLIAFLHQNGLLDSATHPELGEHLRFKPRVRFRNAIAKSRDYFSLGEHTRPLLHELGYSSEDVKTFIDTGVVIDGDPASVEEKIDA